MLISLKAFGQDIETVPVSNLPLGTIVKGLYMIEVDDGSGQYLRQSNGELKKYTLNASDEAFYFWITENVWTEKFQIYSSKNSSKIIKIESNGKGKLVTCEPGVTNPENNLVFRMYSEGPVRTTQDSIDGIVAIGHIITEELQSNFGNNKCNCNVLEAGNASYILHQANNSFPVNYIPIAFEKAGSNSGGSIQIVDNQVKISQSSASEPKNFVSSKFFVGGFSEEDFKITFQAGVSGSVGFVDYQYHHLVSDVYELAKPKLGIKADNGVISLFYLSGDQTLPFTMEEIGREVVTDFNFDSEITFGFKDQYSFVAKQGNKTYELNKIVPADVFLNQSITRSGRMLAHLTNGTVKLSYSPKNNLLNSPDDFGEDNGANFTSTSSYFPYNGGDALVNKFDWQETQWKVRYYGDNGTVEELVYSPFYENGLAFSSIAARFSPSGEYIGAEDYAVEEGWELIKANLGYYANGNIKGQAPSVPYVIFYNKIASTLRVILFANNQGEANQLTVSLGIDRGRPGNYSDDPTYIPKIWGSLQQFKSLDVVAPSWYSKGMPFYSTAGRRWYYTDFTMEYDPCIAFFESSIEVKLNKITDGDVTMVGRFEGGSLPAGTPEYDNWRANNENFLVGVMDNSFGSLENTLGDITFNQYENFDLMEFNDSVGGRLIGKDIEDWEKEKARIEWEATRTIGRAEITDGSFQIAEGVATIAEGAGKMGGPIGDFFGGDQVQGIAKMAQGAAKIGRGASKVVLGDARLDLAYAKKLQYDNIKDKTKHSDQNIMMEAPKPRPHVIFGEMALKGKLTIETSIMPNEYIATPGGKYSNIAPEFHNNGTYGGKPLYNNPMGNFTMLNQPQFAVGVARDGNYFNAHLKIKEKPYFAFNNQITGKIGDMLVVAMKVETVNSAENKVAQSSIGDAYTTVFGMNDAMPLPGDMDISYLVNWNQIHENINALSDQSISNIEAHLSSWIRISYNVWSITMSNLKGRDLNRTFGNVSQFYTGVSQFAFEDGASGRDIVNSEFADYNFGDNTSYGFGNRYNIYNTDNDFLTIMQTYCDCQDDNSRAYIMKNAPETIITEDNMQMEKTETSLTVYPNPASTIVNFNLISEESGDITIGLYDLAGQNLISTIDRLNGRDELFGKINIDVLQNGVYFLIINLPSGETINQKVIKK